LKAGASSITAVEINSIINDIVAVRINDYWGNLYHQPEVRLVTDEGRSFVRRSTEKYDAIISVHTISNAAIASGALGLAENYVLTREAFEDYLDHLAPDGMIFFTRPEYQIPRLFATACAGGFHASWDGADCQSRARVQHGGKTSAAGAAILLGWFSTKKERVPAGGISRDSPDTEGRGGFQ
jgi:spermidine synthase